MLAQPRQTNRAQAATPAARGAHAARRVRQAAVVVLAVSVFGAVFPYFSSSVGLPLDGAPDWAMTTWRTVLHLVPGAVGVAAGAALLAWARRLDAGTETPRAHVAARAGLAAGGWFAIGPYLWALVEPAHAMGTGGMAGAMTSMGMSWISKVIMPVTEGLEKVAPRMTTANCAFTMGVCHWAVGALVVLGSLAALGAGAGTGPLAALAGDAGER